MDAVLMAACNIISCFVISRILFQFMNGRYERSIRNKYAYILAEIATIIVISCVNFINKAMWNLLSWFVAVLLLAVFFYYEDADKVLKRVLESEAVMICMSVCETFGVILLHGILQLAGMNQIDDAMLYCMDAMFSKIILIFLYYIFISRLTRRGAAPRSRMHYAIYGIMLAYSFVNMIALVAIFEDGRKSYICAVDMGCVVLADLFLMYFVKILDEKTSYGRKLAALGQQTKMQYEYYLAQSRKYDQTVRILHDVDRHIKAIEGLYGAEQDSAAGEYAAEIRDMLRPLMPTRYTENSMLNILLSDKETIMREKNIPSEIKIDNVNLDFISPMDITTIFGNLLDNAIEAADAARGDKYIVINISSYRKMVSVSIENSCGEVKWRDGVPISDKGKDRGIGLLNVRNAIEKYGGSLSLRQEQGRFIADMYLSG